MTTSEIERLLWETTGLQPSSTSMGVTERALTRRMTAHDLTSVEDYVRIARASEQELQALIEESVIPETWFLRDRPALDAMVQYAMETWLPANPAGAVLQILCIPCSTGEEPYSVAMSLLDAGMPREKFRVTALDISLRALASARRAVYTQNSFRGLDQAFRERFFRKVETGFELNSTIREQVSFGHANLAAPNFHAGPNRYNMIFCKNVLIYFDRATQERVINRLAQLLTSSGILFVGPAEGYLASRCGLGRTSYPGYSGYHTNFSNPDKNLDPERLKPGASKKLKGAPAETDHSRANRHQRPVLDKSIPARSGRAESLPVKHSVLSEPVDTPAPNLDKAMELADAGLLDEAVAACMSVISASGGSARAYYILGVVQDARGRSQEAAYYYRRVLYLDPNHHDALLHLALLATKTGDAEVARQLHDRARRAAGTTPTTSRPVAVRSEA